MDTLYDPEAKFTLMFKLGTQVLSHYDKHVFSLTHEKLESKSDIATELGWRDWQIEQLLKYVQDLKRVNALLTKTGLLGHRNSSDTSAQRTLSRLGYTDDGGEEWKPPLGKPPRFDLIDALREEVAELKSQKYINEIKAQGIDEAIKRADGETYSGTIGGEFPPRGQYRAELIEYSKLLRSGK